MNPVSVLLNPLCEPQKLDIQQTRRALEQDRAHFIQPHIQANRPINAKQFGLLCAVKETPARYFEGDFISDSCSYVLEIINNPSFRDLALHILGQKTVDALIPRVELASKHLVVFQEMAKKIQESKADITDSILELCAQNGDKVCYLPGGWRGKSGQMVVVRAALHEGTVANVSILNRLHGVQIHNKVDKSSAMRDLSSPSFAVDLAAQSGKQLFKEWSTLLFPKAPLKDDRIVSDLDFYGRLVCYGKQIADAGNIGRASKNQFFGSSPMQAVLALFADVFHTSGASVEEYRAFSLVVKLFALIQEFSVYEHNDLNQRLFQEAIDRMLVRAAKIGPDGCHTKAIEEVCANVRDQLVTENLSHLQTLISGTRMTRDGVISAPKYQSKYNCGFERNGVVSSFSYYPFTIPETPENLVSQLKTFKESFSNRQTKYSVLRGFLREVPCTSNQKFWGALSSSVALELLEQLQLLASAMPESKNWQLRQLRAELSLLALDMAAVCASKISSLKFDDTYTLNLNILTGHDAAFADPDAVRNLERVKANFARRKEGKIALFSAQINMKESVEVAYLLDHIISQTELKRFLGTNRKESLESVITHYLGNMQGFKEPPMPGEEFTKPLGSLLYLTNMFVSTSLHNPDKGRCNAYGHYGNLDCLRGVSVTLEDPSRSLPSEFFTARTATVNGLVDDRQNLLYSIKPRSVSDELAPGKVGVIYNSYRHNPEDGEQFTAQIHRELCTLEAGRELRSLNTIDWLSRPQQFEHLYKPQVRDRLETLLFGPESAVTAVRNFPQEVLKGLIRFQALYQENAENASGEYVPVLEWCSSVVDRFRYHLELEHVSKARLKALETGTFLRKYLSGGQKFSTEHLGCLHRAIALSHMAAVVADKEAFMLDLARAAYHGLRLSEPAWPILLGMSYSCCRGNDVAKSLCKNEAALSAIVNEQLMTNNAMTWSVDAKDVHRLIGDSAGKKITLDLYTGEVATTTGIIIDLLGPLQQNKAVSQLVQGREKFPVALMGDGAAKSTDGSMYFMLDKESTTHVIKKVYIDFTLKLLYTIKRCGMLEESFYDPKSEVKGLSCYSSTILKQLLGHDTVHTWRVDTNIFYGGRESSFERLMIDAKDPTKAVFQSGFSYVLMHLVDGVWQQSTTQFSYVADSGQQELNDLLSRAVPHVRVEQTIESIPVCGFVFENGQATKILMPSLNISFSYCEQRQLWIYDQDINYKLMTQKSVEALGGYSHGMVLQHVRDASIKRVLLPAFAFAEVSDQPAINRFELLADHPLVCDIAANAITCDRATSLYLALIFFGQRNFVSAPKQLELTRHIGIDSALERKILLQIKRFPILTNSGLSFTIQFLLRAEEHSERFSDPTYKQQEETSEIQRLLRDAVHCYNLSQSHYREGIRAIPESLRVSQWVLDRFPGVGKHEDFVLTSQRLTELEQATRRTTQEYPLSELQNRNWYARLVAATKRVAEAQEKASDDAKVASEDPLQTFTESDLTADFLQLAQCAVSESLFENAKVRSYILSYLNQNQTQSHYGFESLLLELLLILLANPQSFRRILSINDKDTVSFVVSALEKVNSDKSIKTPCSLFSSLAPHKTPLDARVALPALLASEALPWRAPIIDESIFAQWPTQKLYESNFEERKQRPYEHSQWPIAKWTSDTKLEAGLIDGLNKAFDRLRKAERSVHVAKGNIVLDLEARKEQLEIKIASKEARINRLLNHSHLATLDKFLALRASQELGVLRLEHVLQALLNRSHRPLLSQNPTLSAAQLNEIYALTIEHQGLCIERNQLEEIRQCKNDGYGLGEVLFRKRMYDPGKFPEILAYAAATGKDPNPGQVKILEKLFSSLEHAIDQKKVEHLLLEFAAGGGKTMLLIPILCMFLISRGKLPVICNTSDLYYQSLEALPPLLKAAYTMQLELIDRDVEHQWSLEELGALKTKLQRWHKHQGRAILMKESSWHSLNTAGKIAAFESVMKNDQQALMRRDRITEILAYFKEHGVRLEDECQENSDPHEVTIRSFETGKAVPLQYHDIYYNAYKIASSVHKLGSVAGPEIARASKEACIQFFVGYKPFEGLTWLKSYLESALNAARPKALIELNRIDPDKADLCILAKACIHLHLPHSGSLTLGKEFGASIHEGDMTAAPRHDGRSTSAHFTDTMLIDALTIQKAIEVGIPVEHLSVVVTGLRDEHESALFKNERITFVEEQLAKVTQNSLFRMQNCSDAQLAKQLEKYLQNPWLVERYLQKHALLQNRFHGRFAKSTPAEMALGFNVSIQMSAFVGLQQIYSVLVSPNKDLLDAEFTAEVLAVLMERNIEGVVMEDRRSPTSFFDELYKKNPKNFAQLRAFFDKGIFANVSPEQLVQGAMNAAHKKGLPRHGITWENEKTIKMPTVLMHEIEGRSIAKTIAGFPLRQTTGRDYPELEHTARAAFLLGKKVTLGGVVQAAMRARKLLISNAQTLFWCVMDDLWATISPGSKAFDVEKALQWSLKNFCDELGSKVLVRAYQGIEAELHGVAWRFVYHADRRSSHMLKVLCPSPETRPWELYAKEHAVEETAKALQNYAAYVQQQLKLTDSEISAVALDRIKRIIDQTAALVDYIHTSGAESLYQIGFQNQEVNARLQARSTVGVGVNKTTTSESYGPADSLEQFDPVNSGFQRFTVAGIDPKKLPELYLPSSARLTARKDWGAAIKPLSHVLVLQDSLGQWQYHALTEVGARFYVAEILKLHCVNYPKTRAFVAAIGKTVLASTFTMDLAQCEELLNTERFAQMVLLLNFVVNRAFDAHVLIATIKQLDWTRADYRAFCQYVRASTPPDEDFAPEKYEDELFA